MKCCVCDHKKNEVKIPVHNNKYICVECMGKIHAVIKLLMDAGPAILMEAKK